MLGPHGRAGDGRPQQRRGHKPGEHVPYGEPAAPRQFSSGCRKAIFGHAPVPPLRLGYARREDEQGMTTSAPCCGLCSFAARRCGRRVRRATDVVLVELVRDNRAIGMKSRAWQRNVHCRRRYFAGISKTRRTWMRSFVTAFMLSPFFCGTCPNSSNAFPLPSFSSSLRNTCFFSFSSAQLVKSTSFFAPSLSDKLTGTMSTSASFSAVLMPGGGAPRSGFSTMTFTSPSVVVSTETFFQFVGHFGLRGLLFDRFLISGRFHGRVRGVQCVDGRVRPGRRRRELARGEGPNKNEQPDDGAAADHAQEDRSRFFLLRLLEALQASLHLASGDHDRRSFNFEPVELHAVVMLAAKREFLRKVEPAAEALPGPRAMDGPWRQAAASDFAALGSGLAAAGDGLPCVWPPRPGTKSPLIRPAGTHGPSLPRRTRCSGFNWPFATNVLSCWLLSGPTLLSPILQNQSADISGNSTFRRPAG